MKVNEKIQYYRKKAGLSQEALGKRLLVSRQTVSLWETGQTLPTLDNLIRLREIFGVSIDEILLEDDAPLEDIDENSVKPYESYSFNYTLEDVKRIDKSIYAPAFTIFSIFFVLFAVSAVVILTLPKPRFDNGIFLAVTFMAMLVSAFLPLSSLKDCRATRSERIKTDHTLLVFGDRFVLEKRMGGALYEVKTVLYERIKNVIITKDILTICSGNTVYSFKRSTISAASLLYSVSGKNDTSRKVHKTLLTASRVFFVISTLLIFAFPLYFSIFMNCPTVISLALSGSIALISITSIILGVILLKKRMGGIKSIVSGVISLFLIVVISCSSIGSEKYTPIEDAEYFIGIDIPDDYDGININTVEDYHANVKNTYVYYEAEIYFSDNAVLDFESKIEKDSLWLTLEEARELLALCPNASEYQGAEYFVFYEFTTPETNHSLAKDEFASYLLVAYFVDENMMIITEYDVNAK